MNCTQIKSNLPDPSPCEHRLPGVERLLFIPRADVEAINAQVTAVPTNYGDVVTLGSAEDTQQAITVKSGKEFAEVYAQYEMGELVYSPQGQRGSRSFRVELEVFHPGFKAQILGYLTSVLNVELLLLAGLADGTWHIIGSTVRGAKLSEESQATSGKAVTDGNGATLKFVANAAAPQVMWRGWDPDDPVRGIERYRVAYYLCTEDSQYAITTEDDELIEAIIY